MTPIPTNYKIKFTPNLSDYTFLGEEVLTFNVDKTTNQIFLDSIDLEIEKIELKNSDILVDSFDFKDKKQLTINFSKNLIEKTEYNIVIGFRGIITDGLAGWYKAKYQVDDQDHYIATTHFEAADARRVFPSVDHPNYKATFEIAVEVEKGLMAVANTLPVKEEDRGDKKYIEFGKSPKMSTYLLYLGVGEFEYIEDKHKDVVIRGITTSGKKEYTRFGVDTAKKVLEYFEDYFGYKYPLEKLDLLAIPDFAAGAMENWGAITFRETALLFYPGKTSVMKKNYVAEVVAHELAHQWFGNLVTMKWWNDLWLNESFATFMAYKAIDHYWKEWDVWTQYVSDTTFAGMGLDSLKSSHPIQVEVTDAEEIDELFDEIAYDKGGSILRMLENYLSEDTFRDGLRAYIKNFEYQNAEGKDLWETLESTSQKPVTKLMQSFIEQVGFPVITAQISQNILKLKQQRFSLSEIKDEAQSWIIPLVIANGENTKRDIFEKTEGEIEGLNNSKFININEDYSGFYLSDYSDELLERIGNNFDKLNNKSRLGVLHDLYYLAYSTKISLDKFTRFVEKYLNNEKDFLVLDYALEKILSLYKILEKESLKPLLLKLSKQSLDLVGMEPKNDEAPLPSVLRTGALYSLAFVEDKDTVQFIQAKFSDFLKDNESLHSNFRGIIYATAVMTDNTNYEKVLDLYRKTDVQEEKMKFLSALGYPKDKKLIGDTLKFATSDEVRFANLMYVFASLSGNIYANDQVFEWLMNNWKDLVKKSEGMASMILRRVLQYVIPTAGIKHAEEAMKFLDDNAEESLKMTFAQVREQLQINLRFVRENK